MTTWLTVVSTLALLWTLQGPPATDVFVASLTRVDGKLSVGKPINISASPGYDNQPFFTPDGRSLLFTSARGATNSKCGSPQTDIYRYDLAQERVTQVTDTPECEYSPTVTPDGMISVIRVEADGTQRLWRFTAEGKSPEVILADVKPVGYHAWLDEKTLGLFVLGEPATLQVADVTTGKSQILARGIGQSILRMPKGGVSFVQQEGSGAERTLTVTQVTMVNGAPVTKALTSAVPGATQAHLAWTPDGTLLMVHEGWLHARTDGSQWRRVVEMSTLGLKSVTRLAVSPRGDRIALVAQP